MRDMYHELGTNVGLATDLYELTMAQAYFDRGMDAPASFSLFVRSLPADWGFFVAAGLDAVLSLLETFRYPSDALAYLETTGLFSRAFLDWLGAFRFRGAVHALAEGEVFFPGEPILEVTGTILEAQIVETAVVNRASLASLIASKATRSVLAGAGRELIDFAARRTQGLEAGLTVARSSYLAGYAGTSNVMAGKVFGLPIYGTMAHSFVMCFDDETDAFSAFADTFPAQSVLLVDTYDTIAGVRKAIAVGRDLARRGHRLRGVRLDSGDLARLAHDARALLDDAGMKDAIIVASGGLNEHKVAALIAAHAPIDIFAIGSDLGVAADAPVLDIAYKLVEYAGTPRLKLSTGKQTLAGRKQLYRRRDAGGVMSEDLIATREEPAPGNGWSPGLLSHVMDHGERVRELPSLPEARAACAANLARLPAGLVRLENPTRHPVHMSQALEARQQKAAGAVRV
jgi:nicotinate phosphoribosyltransferase